MVPSGSLIWVRFRGWGKEAPPPCSSIGGWTVYGGCGPSASELQWGPQTVKSGAFHAERMAKKHCPSSCVHLLTVPGGLASGAQPQGFKMASALLPLREEEKGREGVAAQPPGLFCVGRLPLPVSVLGERQWQQAGVAAAECPSLLSILWAWEGCFWYCCFPVPQSRGVSSQPLPKLVRVTLVTEMWDSAVEPGDTWLLGCSVSLPLPTSLAPKSPAQVLGLATPPTLG